MRVESYDVRIIRKGETYGLGGCFVHTQDDPLVEFLWVGAKHRPYRAGRYYASTLLATTAGLNLGDGLLATKAGLSLGDGLLVSGEGMNQVRAWLRSLT